MPLYVYRCDDGHVTEQIVRLDGSDAPTHCRACIDHESINCRCEKRACREHVPRRGLVALEERGVVSSRWSPPWGR